MLADTISSTYAQEGENSSRWTNNNNDTLSVSTETNRPISGNASLRVDIKPAATVEELTNSSWSVISTDFIPVNRSGYHDYGLDVSAKDVNQLHSKLYHYDSNKKEISSDFIFGGRDGTFKQGFDNTVLSPAAAKYMKLQMWVKPSVGKNASYLVDNIELGKNGTNLRDKQIAGDNVPSITDNATQFSHSKEEYAWTIGAEMPTNRSESSGEVLNGKIYIIGGGDVLNSIFPIIGNLGMTDIVEVYDPESNTWHPAAALPEPLDHAAAASHNGKLYIVGGFDKDGNSTDKLYIYDPSDDKWKEGKDMPTARGASTAEFINGILYVIGGMNRVEGSGNERPLRMNEAYNPETNTWAEKSPMPTPRNHLDSAVVDGKLFAIGGRMSDVKSNVNVNEMYDPKQDAWTKLDPMLLNNSGLGVASVGDRIYVFGGTSPLLTAYGNTAEYDPESDKWTRVISLPTPRMGLEAVAINDKIYIIGGKTGPTTNASGTNEIFNIKP